jgi:hypothetical protein
MVEKGFEVHWPKTLGIAIKNHVLSVTVYAQWANVRKFAQRWVGVVKRGLEVMVVVLKKNANIWVECSDRSIEHSENINLQEDRLLHKLAVLESIAAGQNTVACVYWHGAHCHVRSFDGNA